MKNNLRLTQPSLFSVLVALLMAGFAFVFMQTGLGVFTGTDAGRHVLMRTMFVAATCLLMFDVLEGAFIARRGVDHKNPHFWIYGFYMGYFWMALMVLMQWDGMESAPRLLLTWGLGGVFFGGVMSWLGEPKRASLEGIYHVDKPVTGSAFAFLYYAWPAVVVGLLATFLAFPPVQGWDDRYFLFQMVFLGSVMPLFHHDRSQMWRHIWPRLLGLGLLVAGLFVT
ncbi:MAG: hypothetical protein AAF727_14570 [Pseudomonadota bacterium]